MKTLLSLYNTIKSCGKIWLRFLIFIFSSIAGSIFPKKQIKSGSVTDLRDAYIKSLFSRNSVFFENGPVRAFLPYKNPDIKKNIWQFKYYLNTIALRDVTYLLCDEILALLTDQLIFSNVLIVPVPSSMHHAGKKSFNHMDVVLNLLDKEQNGDCPFFYIVQDIIKINTQIDKNIQHVGKRYERLQWAENKYYIDNTKCPRDSICPAEKKPTYIICIDDITTTGATLSEIHRLLSLKFKCKVECLAMAH